MDPTRIGAWPGNSVVNHGPVGRYAEGSVEWRPGSRSTLEQEFVMQRLGNGLFYAGLAALVVGLLGLLSQLLRYLGVPFVFPVSPWYGPFLGGLLLTAVGWALRRQPVSADRPVV